MFLTAEWRHLAILNYEVDPRLLLKLVPRETELDQWNGKSLISLVGFLFLKTKVFGIPIPFHRNFEEVNLRFYVQRRVGSETKRGVAFIREIVPRWAIATLARTCYNENYVALPMSYRICPKLKSALAIEYGWRSTGGWNRMKLSVTGDPALPSSGSEEQFITEHYWGYAAQRDGGCMEYRVTHPSWRVWSTQDARFEGDAEELYGKELAAVLRKPPQSGFLAEGSKVTVSTGRRV